MLLYTGYVTDNDEEMEHLSLIVLGWAYVGEQSLM